MLNSSEHLCVTADKCGKSDSDELYANDVEGDKQYECVTNATCWGLAPKDGFIDEAAKKCVEAGKCETADTFTKKAAESFCVEAEECGANMVGDSVTGSKTKGQCIDIATCQAEAEDQCVCEEGYDQSTDGYHCCPTGQDWDDGTGACVEDNPTGDQPHRQQQEAPK